MPCRKLLGRKQFDEQETRRAHIMGFDHRTPCRYLFGTLWQPTPDCQRSRIRADEARSAGGGVGQAGGATYLLERRQDIRTIQELLGTRMWRRR